MKVDSGRKDLKIVEIAAKQSRKSGIELRRDTFSSLWVLEHAGKGCVNYGPLINGEMDPVQSLDAEVLKMNKGIPRSLTGVAETQRQ